MTQTLYAKVTHGKRTSYAPVAETVYWDSLPAGSHLLFIQPGSRSCIYNVSPNHADVLAALRTHRDELLTVLRDASAARPASRLLTPKERKAIAAYAAIVGPNAMYTMTIPAAASVIDALEAALIKAV